MIQHPEVSGTANPLPDHFTGYVDDAVAGSDDVRQNEKPATGGCTAGTVPGRHGAGRQIDTQNGEAPPEQRAGMTK